MLSGDLRTGQQLLDDATTDAFRTIGRAAHSRVGSAELNQITAYLEARLGDVERALRAGAGTGGHWRPPWDQWRGPQAEARPAVVLHPSRPIAQGWGGIRLDGDGPALPFMASRRLAQPGARWAWNLGFDAARLVRLIAAVPPRLAEAMRRLLTAKQCAAQAAAQRLAVASAGMQPAAPAGMVVGCWPPHQLQPQPDEDEVAAMWEEAAEVALVLDPATQRRARLTCSTGVTRLWGQHREELLARFAAHEGCLPFTDLGALCALLADACCGRDGGVVLYHRFSFGQGAAARAVLVCESKSREFDSLGRVRKVSVTEGVAKEQGAGYCGRAEVGRDVAQAILIQTRWSPSFLLSIFVPAPSFLSLS